MNKQLEKILLVVKANDEKALETAKVIKKYLIAQNREVGLCSHYSIEQELEQAFSDKTCDLFLVLGGDGTFVSVARRYHHMAPLLGLNFGRVGFLTELSVLNWEQALSKIILGQYRISERSCLVYKIIRAGEAFLSACAVNDIVLSRFGISRLIEFNLRKEHGEDVTFRADSLIVSTPTGSSAYAMSAGASLVHPELPAILFTAVCPFLKSFHPLVLPDTQTYEIALNSQDAELLLTADGQHIENLQCGDIIQVARHEQNVMIVESFEEDYLSRLKKRNFLCGS